MINRNIIKKCIKCGKYKRWDACLICNSCTEKLCIEEWGENWINKKG